MRKLFLAVSTAVLLAISASAPVAADKDQFVACQMAGFSANVCATCTNPSRGAGTSGSTAVCLCKTQLAELGDEEFRATYGNFGKCIQLQHSQGVD